MELPQNIYSLYRHWDDHTTPLSAESSIIAIPEKLSWFIKERLRIWEQKISGGLPPYTNDPIMAKYRFCNIFREFDKQTLHYHGMLSPLRDDFPLWLLNMFYARMVARPETLELVGLLSFEKAANRELYEKLTASPRPRYGTPYVFPVSVIQRSKTPTRELFITEFLPTVMHTIAKEITTWKKISVHEGVARILPLFGYNLAFLWTEVLIDVAYQYPEHLDLFARFPIGPGSAPTFKRLAPDVEPSIFVSELANIPFDTGITVSGKQLRLSAENWEGVGCEFRKYTNLNAGHGRKRIYKK